MSDHMNDLYLRVPSGARLAGGGGPWGQGEIAEGGGCRAPLRGVLVIG